MNLYRVTPDPFENSRIEPKFAGQQHDRHQGCGANEAAYVVTKFDRFGGGSKRQSDFEVMMQWHDVEAIIDEFCKANHPSAVKLQSALELAEAIEELGWRAPENSK
jgi:hypothetical protein